MFERMTFCFTFIVLTWGAPARAQITNPAMNNPDKFGWDLFLEVNQPAADLPKQVIWETWIEQNLVFGNPCITPVWPHGKTGAKTFRKSLLLVMVNRNSMSGDPFPSNQYNFQEVRFNKVMYDYIVANNLWYQEGILAAASAKTIEFPPSSMVVKSEWAPIPEADKDRYYWTVHIAKLDGGNGKPRPILLGLVGIHIVSKAIPTWSWHTWEHVDNAGRCDYIGCQDRYGSTPAYIEPHRQNGLEYRPGKLKPYLLERFEADNLDEIWRFYRLKGSQNSFTDPRGNPTLLANSIMEPGFGYASSCITCHAMATLGPPGTMTGEDGQSLNFMKSMNPFEGYVGVPDPGWYSRRSAGLPLAEIPIVYQTDFLWSLASLSQPRTECGQQSPGND